VENLALSEVERVDDIWVRLGSARVSRAGDGVLAIANFDPQIPNVPMNTDFQNGN